MSDPAELGRLYPRLSAPMRVYRASAERAIVEESGGVGLARAMARHAGARGGQDKNQVDRYLFKQRFLERAEEVVCGLGAERVEDVRAAVDRISIEDCPGWWLWQHAQLAFRKANAEPAPGDFFDVEHLLYFPYFDLLFADKRTFAYAVLALKDER